MSKDHRRLVTGLVRESQAQVVVEIGVLRGHLSKQLWSIACVEKLILVDSYDVENFSVIRDGKLKRSKELDRKEEFSQRTLDEMYKSIMKAAPDNVEFMRMTSIEAAALVPNSSVDLVFLDTMHFYEDVIEDIDAWLPKIKRGGVFSGDDMSNRFPGVRKAVAERLPSYRNYGRVWWATVGEEIEYTVDSDGSNWMAKTKGLG